MFPRAGTRQQIIAIEAADRAAYGPKLIIDGRTGNVTDYVEPQVQTEQRRFRFVDADGHVTVEDRGTVQKALRAAINTAAGAHDRFLASKSTEDPPRAAEAAGDPA